MFTLNFPLLSQDTAKYFLFPICDQSCANFPTIKYYSFEVTLEQRIEFFHFNYIQYREKIIHIKVCYFVVIILLLFKAVSINDFFPI